VRYLFLESHEGAGWICLIISFSMSYNCYNCYNCYNRELNSTKFGQLPESLSHCSILAEPLFEFITFFLFATFIRSVLYIPLSPRTRSPWDKYVACMPNGVHNNPCPLYSYKLARKLRVSTYNSFFCRLGVKCVSPPKYASSALA